MSKIIFISSALQQPRHQKRIATLSSEFECEVVYFERDKYKINYNGLEFTAKSIGKVRDGKYLSRFFLLFKLFLYLIISKNKYVYCTSIDQALISFLSRKVVVMELGDIVQLDSNLPFYRFIDKFIIKRISGLVLTSPFYWSGYYKALNVIDENDCIIVENKLPEKMRKEIESYRENIKTNKFKEKICIGVIGSLSFREPLKRLVDLVSKRKNIEVHVFGDGVLDVFEGCEGCFIHGPFKNPDDLRSIYSKVDINYVVYDSFNNNVKIALPNKLYESIAFCRPIICANDVALADVVNEKEIGVSCSLDGIDSAINKICDNYDFYFEKIIALEEFEYLDLTKTELLSFVRERFEGVESV